jgi:aryl-alcohol dehydrogenase-like predicted oxidoreductase/spore coat polysaccharide biosynthesis protein SpsF (cytidylyltransferase family)
LKSVTIIQARTLSTRLPGKALLRVAGYPSAILATMRAANRGHETILATSDDPSDDELARQAEQHGLRIFRGPLNDVLARYALAASHLPDDCAIVRLTADNLIPDGAFVEELVRAFAGASADYMNTDSLLTGLPYGLGGEVFTVAVLRKAHQAATSASDREHVSPWIRRHWRTAVSRPKRSNDSDYSHLRATIDDEQDYQRMVRLFTQIDDPRRVGWEQLLHKLAELPGEARFRIPYKIMGGRAHSRLTLGTAQLGMEYGIVNDAGQPSPQRATQIVHAAVAHGVTTIDTARGYGTAEAVLGNALAGSWASRCEVITKLDLSELPPDALASEVIARVDESVENSCKALRVSRLSVLLLHRWQDHYAWGGAGWEHLLKLQQDGKIGILGASLYEPREALQALRDPAIRHLQIPMNVLDWRWEAAGIGRAVAERPDVLVHARSALLQGLLTHPASRWPVIEDFSASGWPQILRQVANQLERESVTDLCLAYVRSLPWVTSVVVGCETIQQLEENLRLFRTRELTPEQCEEVRHNIPRAPENLLNPSKWKAVHEPATP